MYLFDNADAEAVIVHSSLTPRLENIIDQLPDLRTVIVVDDDGIAHGLGLRYEALIATTPPAPRITSKDFVMAKKTQLLKRIADGHTTTSLSAAMKEQGVPAITPRRLGELLELPRRGKNKRATKKRSTSDA